MITLSIKAYRKRYKKTNPQIAEMFGLTVSRVGHLGGQGYTISTSDDGKTSILAPVKNIYRKEVKS